MANPFVYTELNTSDVSSSKTFYSKLFDWKLEDTFDRCGIGAGDYERRW